MEVEDIVKELIASEKDSRNLVDEARTKAKKMIVVADKEGKTLLNSRISEAREIAKGIVEKAEAEAKTQSEKMIKKTQDEIKLIKERYTKVKDIVISEFISEIVQGKKNG